MLRSAQWSIFTIESIINEYKNDIVEFNYEYEITEGRYSLKSMPLLPKEPNMDEVMRLAEVETKNSIGILKGMYWSIFNKEKIFKTQMSVFDNLYHYEIKIYQQNKKDVLLLLEKLKIERDNFIANKSQYIDEKLSSWIESIVNDKDDANSLLFKRIIINNYNSETFTFGIAWIAKLIRAYHLGFITGDGSVLERLLDDERKKVNLAILKRDKHQCQLCGETYQHRGLDVHHIIHLDYCGTHNLNNLITLCVVCHSKQHSHKITNAEKVKKIRRGGVFVVVDIETTGFSNNDEIIEIAAILFENGYAKRKFGGLIYSDRTIPPLVEKITGITNQMLIGRPTMDYVFPRFMRFINNLDIVVHNKSFDERFIKRYADKYGFIIENHFIDTLDLARRKLPHLTSHKLQDLAFYFDIKGINFHRAYDDAITTGKVYLSLINTKKTSLKRK